MLRFYRSILSLLFLAMPLLPSFGQDPDGYSRLMQGPMLGPVSTDAFTVWVRASWEWPVQVAYATQSDFSDMRVTEAVTPVKARNYIATLKVEGLEPSTTYYYKILVAEGEDKYLGGKPSFRVRTAPPVGAGGKFRVAYGSCARWQREPLQPIWNILPEFAPDLFFWLGDNVYADTLDPDIIAEEFLRQRDVPHLRPFLATVPQLAIWDDHDYGLNNHDRRNPIKEGALEVWKRYWPNPSYGLSDTPGIFFKYAYGGVDFFFLDTRYYRDPNEDPDGPGKTMLGAGQLAWLKEGLATSRSPFKVLISGSLWSKGKGHGGDAWSSFVHERDGLFDWIMQSGITGVVLLAGDPHSSELNVMRWSRKGGYDLYEMVSSPLAQESDLDWIFRPVEQRLRVPYSLGPNFGLLDFDMGANDPTLTFEIISLERKSVWKPLILRASELRPGVSSWAGNQSGEAKRWMKQFGSGWEGED